MIRAEEALERLRSANPLPDDEHVDQGELALFVAHFEERRSSMTTTDVPRRAERQPDPTGRRRRPAWVFAAALVAVLALVGGIALVVGGGEESDVATTPAPEQTATAAPTTSAVAPPTTVATTTTEPTTTSTAPGPELGAFVRFVPTGIDGEVHDVVVGPTGFVAVGGVPGFDGHGSGYVWTSPDGITWSATQLTDAAGGGSSFNGVAYGPAGYVIAGGDEMWHSPDLVTWTVVHDRGAESVVYGDAGYVAAGTADVPVAGGGVWWISVVYHSPDGISWSQVEDADLGEVGVSFSVASDLTYGAGTYVLVGRDESLAISGAVWASTDGREWVRIAHSDEVFAVDGEGNGADVYINGVTYGAHGFVAVGAALGDRLDSLVWTSPDGLTWSRVAQQPALGDAVDLLGVAYGRAGYVAVGDDWSQESAAVLVSVDGLAWDRVEDEFLDVRGTSSYHVAADASRYLVLGDESTDGVMFDPVAVWIAGVD